MAPAELVFALAFEALAAAGRGAGVTLVRVGAVEVVVRQAARALLYHLVQSLDVALVVVVVLTAPAGLPPDV